MLLTSITQRQQTKPEPSQVKQQRQPSQRADQPTNPQFVNLSRYDPKRQTLYMTFGNQQHQGEADQLTKLDFMPIGSQHNQADQHIRSFGSRQVDRLLTTKIDLRAPFRSPEDFFNDQENEAGVDIGHADRLPDPWRPPPSALRPTRGATLGKEK